jgi:hypothetical protein
MMISDQLSFDQIVDYLNALIEFCNFNLAASIVRSLLSPFLTDRRNTSQDWLAHNLANDAGKLTG